MKRVFDIAGVTVSIVFLFPLVPFIALAIFLEGGLPIFIQLDRVSGGRVIRAYKFRSMVRVAEALKEGLWHLNERVDGPLFKIKNDPRITKVGKVLRKFRLDEFPQLINVLRGELSLVGPRPHEPGEVAAYPPEFQTLPLMRAGVTGLSQVNGASRLPFRRELELDLFYVNHQSLWLDSRILLKTVWIIFTDPSGI
jgi:lipopolysaccharide/colanic/teichoic acid biosynthesis glycosyltransferase